MTTKHFPELGYAVMATVKEHSVDYAIVSGEYKNGEPVGFSDNCEFEKPKDAPYEIRGFVKWDGCSNWKTNPECMMHVCTRQQLVDIGTILSECYDWTKELLPTFYDR